MREAEVNRETHPRSSKSAAGTRQQLLKFRTGQQGKKKSPNFRKLGTGLQSKGYFRQPKIKQDKRKLAFRL